MTVKYGKILIYLLVSALLLPVLISGCTLLNNKRDEVPKIDMIVTNPLPIKRTDEFVTLKIAQLKEFAPDFSSDTFIVLEADSNAEIPHQLDDMDNDGERDEIAMIMNMEPGEQKRIVIRYSPEGRAVNLGYDKRTRAAMHPEYEGIGWESELIAYRIYPDQRNAISIFGKQEPGLSLDKFAASVADRGYNRLESWGVSVLDGDNSLGCGGFGVWQGSKLVMPSKTAYTRIAADGPIRSMVQVIFDNWRVGDQTLRVTATYSIFAGQRWTRSEIKVEGAENPMKIAAGLMKSEAATLTRDEENGFFYTWGTQSHTDPPDDLGMAVIYPPENFDSFHENDKSGAHLAVLNPGADNEIVYWSLAVWSHGDIGIRKDALFAETVSAIARRIRYPLTVTIMPTKPPPVEGTEQQGG